MSAMAEDQDISARIKTIDGDEYEIVDDVGTDDEEKEAVEDSKDAAENGPDGVGSKEIKAVSKQRFRRFPSKEHPVPCDVCKVLFTRADALRAHKTEHTGEKQFTCPVCKKSYKKARYLREHKKSHVFAHEKCPKEFGRSHHLAQHHLEHVGERRYKCELCGKGYLKPRYLRDHKKSCQKRNASCAEAKGKVEDNVKANANEEPSKTDVRAE